MLKILVCVSGGGTNLQAIIDAIASGTLENTEIIKVIANNPGAYALERAKNAGIEAASGEPDRMRKLYMSTIIFDDKAYY